MKIDRIDLCGSGRYPPDLHIHPSPGRQSAAERPCAARSTGDGSGGRGWRVPTPANTGRRNQEQSHVNRSQTRFHPRPNIQKSVVACLATLLMSTAALVAAPPVIPENVRDNVIQRIQSGETVGVVIGLAAPDGVVYFSHHREAKGDPREFDAHTIFEIGSITKVFTAMLLVDTARRGEVRLDDRVDRFLPDSVAESLAKRPPITLLDLATHRSGLPRMPDNFDPADAENPYADYSAEKLYEFLRSWAAANDRDRDFEYSNVGTGLLGHALTRATGKSYETLLRDRIADPLGMADTRIELTDEQKKRLAAGHLDDKQVKGWTLDALVGAGGVRSTVSDMIRFVSAFLGKAPDNVVELTREMTAKQFPTGRDDASVALAWIVERQHNAEIFWHNGGTGGYHSFCGFRPDKKIGVVVLTNSTHDIDDIGKHLLEPAYPLHVPQKQVKVSSDKIEDFVGFYELQPGIVLHITQKDDALFAQITGQQKFAIYPSSETSFFYKVADARIEFQFDEKKRVSGLKLLQFGREIPARKLENDYKPPVPKQEIDVDTAILQTYVGKYIFPGGGVFEIRLENGKLSAQLSGNPRLPIFAESETSFFFKVVDAQVAFQKDESGKITGLIFRQGSIDQRATRQD